jgi:hypothetical protein
LQKIIRNAKKMQEKMPVFYKELNRVRKAALSFGFYDLFEGIHIKNTLLQHFCRVKQI